MRLTFGLFFAVLLIVTPLYPAMTFISPAHAILESVIVRGTITKGPYMARDGQTFVWNMRVGSVLWCFPSTLPYCGVRKGDTVGITWNSESSIPFPEDFWEGTYAEVLGTVVGSSSGELPRKLISLSLDSYAYFVKVNKWAVLIGINEYYEPMLQIGNIKGAVEGAKKLYNLLADRFLFPKSSMRLLTDSVDKSGNCDVISTERQDCDVTGKVVLDALTWLGNNVKEHDIAVFYFAGHGGGDAFGEPETLQAHPGPGDPGSLSDDAFAAKVDSLFYSASRLVIILDASWAGGFICEGDGQGGLPFTCDGDKGELPSIVVQEHHGAIFMAGCEENRGDDARDCAGNSKGAIFTRALVDGFRVGDNNKDGVVSVEEAFTYARANVQKWWKYFIIPHTEQVPVIYDDYNEVIPWWEGDIVLSELSLL